MEFARQSSDGRLTLVIVPPGPVVRALWAPFSVVTVEAAREALRKREGVPEKNREKDIAVWLTGDENDSEPRPPGNGCSKAGRRARLNRFGKKVGRMAHPVYRVTAFEIVGPYCIRIEFADGVVRTIDFRPVLDGELYGPLRDLDQFNSVTLDREVHTLTWANGADFDPATLHDWPEHEAAMVNMARRWAAAGAGDKRAG